MLEDTYVQYEVKYPPILSQIIHYQVYNILIVHGSLPPPNSDAGTARPTHPDPSRGQAHRAAGITSLDRPLGVRDGLELAHDLDIVALERRLGLRSE